ncbi:hypothetical protein BDZ89DRAFT_1060495 [Hymenopellis radicata]|nr:hypothetical protein BDZ89DRAFT_1060495 [Hymenopellis radicata]
MASHTISVLGAGAMGSKLAERMHSNGAGDILTNLDGRSEETHERARESGMAPTSYADIVSKATCIISVVPPHEAQSVAELVVNAYKALSLERAITFADCNAVNPDSVKEMAKLFEGTNITFLDGSIIGLPPSDTYNPGIYVSSNPGDEQAFDEFTEVTLKYGLNVFAMKGEGAHVGDASALKMAHSAIVKGTIGLITTSVLAANASSPSTAKSLVHALDISQPLFVELSSKLLAQMLPKAYRFVREMEEVGGYIGGPTGSKIFEDLGDTYAKVAKAHEDYKKDSEGAAGGDADVLLKFAEEAKKTVRANEEAKKARE